MKKTNKSKSIAAILALTTASLTRADIVEGDGDQNAVLEADQYALAVVSTIVLSASSRHTHGTHQLPHSRHRSKQRTANHQQASTLRHLKATSNNDDAPGCGPSPGTHHSPYLGCYADKSNDRAFPYELHSGGKNKNRGHGALDCERECSMRGFRYIGREFRGQCFCGGELESIVRHGDVVDGGCDCCGGNVGPHRMCVWENANHKDSKAVMPNLPVISPIQPSNNNFISPPPRHPHIETTSIKNNIQAAAAKPSTTASTHKPTGGFRIRLHWQHGYNWQNSSRERLWCMECRGSCRSGSSIQIDKCSSATSRSSSGVRQQFIAVGRTIRPASNPALCLTVTGFSGTKDPVKLRHCNHGGGANQNFSQVRAVDKFELLPEGGGDKYCLSQHHHPKRHEVVFPEVCEKTRRFDTTYWRLI